MLQDLEQVASSALNSRSSLSLPAALQALERLQVSRRPTLWVCVSGGGCLQSQAAPPWVWVCVGVFWGAVRGVGGEMRVGGFVCWGGFRSQKQLLCCTSLGDLMV